MHPTGWISPPDRTNNQLDAHARCVANAPNYTLPPVSLAKGEMVNLGKFWKHPDVITDIGREFTGFYQFTGSCVGVSGGNGCFTVTAVQRALLKVSKAFIPFWGFAYGRSRLLMGDHNQGEGSIDSCMGKILTTEGCIESTLAGLPQYTYGDGIRLDAHTEMQYSDGDALINTKWLNNGTILYPVKSITPLNSTEQIKASIVNGNPVLYGCDMFIGHGSIAQGGGTPYARGRYDGRGGHSTLFIAYWEHPNDGPLYGYSNQWPGSVYPTDPAGLPRCCVWTPESEVDKIWNWNSNNGETMGMSHLDYLADQPEILEKDWQF